MISDTVIYPHIPLPFGVRMKFLWIHILKMALFPANRGIESSVALEREFEAIITDEHATISRICFSYSGSVAEFDDLRQDALINIWRGMKNYRGEASRKSWIYRITVNSCLSTIRKQIRHQHDSLEDLYGLIEGDESEKDSIEQMHRAIGTLGSQEKAIIMMWLDELSYDEIAEAMGLNRNTVATKIRRIKEKITKEYKKEENL